MATSALSKLASVTAEVSPNAAGTLRESWTLLRNRAMAGVHPFTEGMSHSLQHTAERLGPTMLSQTTRRVMSAVGYGAVPSLPETSDLGGGIGGAVQLWARSAWKMGRWTYGMPFAAPATAALTYFDGGTDQGGKPQSAMQWLERSSFGRYLWGTPTDEKTPLKRSLEGLPTARYSSFEEHYDRMSSAAMNMSQMQVEILRDQLSLLQMHLPSLSYLANSQPQFR